MIDQTLIDRLAQPMTTIEILAKALGISRTAAAGMVKRGEIASVKVGSIYRVQTAPIRKMIGLPEQEPSAQQQAA